MTFPFKDPNQCRVTYGYATPNRRYASGKHDGIDIVSDGSRSVYSVTDGKVIRSGTNKNWGEYIVIQIPDGRALIYAHLATRSVVYGDHVSEGEFIGVMGNTGKNTSGAHLHIELQKEYYQSGNTDDIAEFLEIENEVGKVVFMAKEIRYNTVDEMPGWAQNSIQAMIDKGLIAKSDELNLSEDMIRILMVVGRVAKV